MELGTLVIVEDSQASATVLRQVLRDHLQIANPVVHLLDGDRAVEWLTEAVEADAPPVLVLLDVLLPGRDGMEILRWMRGQESLRQLPVVILTATAQHADIDEAYRSLGADSYLVKPVGFDALGDVLRRLPLRWALLPADRDG